MKFKKHAIELLICAAISAPVLTHAQVVDVKGEAEASIKANGGDLINARRVVREAAERDAIAAVLKLRLSVNPNDPKMVSAANDIRKQLGDNLKTTFRTEGGQSARISTGPTGGCIQYQRHGCSQGIVCYR
jgi:hypothetical protein